MNRSKKRRGFKLILAIITASASLWLAAGIGPRISFEKTSKDFGAVKQGDVLKHVFAFKNTGDATLKISRVQTSCGCTAALLSKEEIAPGQSGEVQVTLNTSGYEDEITKTVYIESNDSVNPRLQLTVSAAVDVPPRPRIELDSYTFDLGLRLNTEDFTVPMKIRNGGERELEVNFSHPNAEFFLNGQKIKSEIKISPGQVKGIQVLITGEKNSGLYREYILLRTNDPVRPNLSLYLSGYILTRKQLKEFFARYKDIIDK